VAPRKYVSLLSAGPVQSLLRLTEHLSASAHARTPKDRRVPTFKLLLPWSGRDAKRDIRPIDLFHAELFRADLPGAQLKGAEFVGADLSDATLSGTDLNNAKPAPSPTSATLSSPAASACPPAAPSTIPPTPCPRCSSTCWPYSPSSKPTCSRCAPARAWPPPAPAATQRQTAQAHRPPASRAGPHARRQRLRHRRPHGGVLRRPRHRLPGPEPRRHQHTQPRRRTRTIPGHARLTGETWPLACIRPAMPWSVKPVRRQAMPRWCTGAWR